MVLNGASQCYPTQHLELKQEDWCTDKSYELAISSVYVCMYVFLTQCQGVRCIIW